MLITASSSQVPKNNGALVCAPSAVVGMGQVDLSHQTMLQFLICGYDGPVLIGSAVQIIPVTASICVIDKKFNGKNVVLVTAKASGSVYEFDLSNGKQIGKWYCSGDSCISNFNNPNKWLRPNGIANW